MLTIGVDEPFPTWLTEVIVGAPGTVRGVTDAVVTEAELPCELAATKENVYAVPFVNPVTTQVSGPLVHVQVAPPGDAVTM